MKISIHFLCSYILVQSILTHFSDYQFMYLIDRWIFFENSIIPLLNSIKCFLIPLVFTIFNLILNSFLKVNPIPLINVLLFLHFIIIFLFILNPLFYIFQFLNFFLIQVTLINVIINPILLFLFLSHFLTNLFHFNNFLYSIDLSFLYLQRSRLIFHFS